MTAWDKLRQPVGYHFETLDLANPDSLADPHLFLRVNFYGLNVPSKVNNEGLKCQEVNYEGLIIREDWYYKG